MNHKHRKILHMLFSHPVSSNISIKEVEHVFKELGADLGHGGAGKLSVKLAGHSVNFHDHSHSLSVDEVAHIRDFLKKCGIDPEVQYPL